MYVAFSLQHGLSHVAFSIHVTQLGGLEFLYSAQPNPSSSCGGSLCMYEVASFI